MDSQGNIRTQEEIEKMPEPFRKAFTPAPFATPEQIKKRKIGRNELCPCGSYKKFKKCCIGKE